VANAGLIEKLPLEGSRLRNVYEVASSPDLSFASTGPMRMEVAKRDRAFSRLAKFLFATTSPPRRTSNVAIVRGP
jgi:hypothetical protein